ncbi:MAG: GIY-YIG nuclease family protein [bacterium]|nr:GIY-YIG nuclease family protein [bacterium]
MAYCVYILRSESTGKTYVDQTNDLKRRLAQHNDPDCRLTLHAKRHKGPWGLLHSEEYATRTEAMRYEKQLKSGQGRE